MKWRASTRCSRMRSARDLGIVRNDSSGSSMLPSTRWTSRNDTFPIATTKQSPMSLSMLKAPVALEHRVLGRTGRGTSILALGTSRLAHAGQRATVRLVREAIDHGVNVIETGWEYGDGRTERWLGLALRDGYRERVLLVWQCCAHLRDYKTAMQQVDESLSRLKTDVLDVWSFHEIIYDNDPDWLYDHGGLDAAQEAREQGKTRWLAFGGHKSPHIHVKLLQRGFAWDVVTMPLNPMDATFRSFEKQVLPEAVRRGIAVMATKPLAAGAIATSRVVKAEESLRYCFSLP